MLLSWYFLSKILLAAPTNFSFHACFSLSVYCCIKLVNKLYTASFYYLASFYALLEFSNVYIFLCYILYEEMANRRRRRGAQYRQALEREKKAQSAVEYLLTYSWAILIIAIVIGVMLYFVLAPSYLPPNTCTFVTGVYCKGIVFGSNAISTEVGLFLSNSQPYPVLSPSLTMNLSGQLLTGTCKPSYVLPGGAIICNVTVSQKAISLGVLESGKLYLSAILCPSGNATICKTSVPETFAGSFNAHVAPLFASTTTSISLTAANSSQAANGAKDQLNATVKMLGYPLAGATVNFTANVPYANITPTITTTDSQGSAISYISSMQSGNVLVTASFAGTTATNTISFTPP